MRKAKYGYGIVDSDGNPFWSENCVCQDKVPMQDVASDLNEEESFKPAKDRTRFRVVTLWRLIR